MAAGKKPAKSYQARITINKLFAYVPVSGKNLEEALANSKEICLSDVLAIDMKDVIDGEVEVQGIDQR